ncbi:MAG: FecR domain-containing protein [Pseudomonadota bacterium]
MHRFAPLALAALLVAIPAAAAAGLAAGMVKNAKGSVTLERAGKALPLAPGAAVMSEDRIVTGADGSAGITLRDDTLLSVGPNSRVSLDKFVFDEATHEGEMSASVKRGTMAVISGKLAKKSPGAVKFVTPSAILGVRGTEFVIDVGAGEQP